MSAPLRVIWASAAPAPALGEGVEIVPEGAPADAAVLDAGAARPPGDAPALFLASPEALPALLAGLEAPDDCALAGAPGALIAHRLRRMARGRGVRDPLTGLDSRAFFLEGLSRALGGASPSSPVTGLLVDLDRFKSYNDTWGHAAGDQRLVALAEALRRECPPGARAGRFSGNVFIAALPADADQARRFAEHLVRVARGVEDGERPPTTISVGAATSTGGVDAKVFLGRVEQAVYAAKARGRDRAVHFEGLQADAAARGGVDLLDFEHLTRVITERMSEVLALRSRRIFQDIAERADTDGLTGLPNRRYFDERLAATLTWAGEHGATVCVALLDIDHFGLVNKAHGWPTGDRALRAVAARLKGSTRADDWVARYGGEEFALVMPGATLEQARPALERLRRAIAEVSFEDSRGEPLRLTASVGAAQAAPAEDPVALLERVSERLLAAKGAGRDRVCV